MSNTKTTVRAVEFDNLTPESFSALKTIVQGCVARYQGSPVTKENKLNSIIATELGYRSFNQLQAGFANEADANDNNSVVVNAFDFESASRGFWCHFCGEKQSYEKMNITLYGYRSAAYTCECGSSYCLMEGAASPCDHDNVEKHVLVLSFPHDYSSEDEKKWLKENVMSENGRNLSYVYDVSHNNPAFIQYMKCLLNSRVSIFDADGQISNEQVREVVSRSHDLSDSDSMSDFIEGVQGAFDTLLICPLSGTYVYAESDDSGALIRFNASVTTEEETSSLLEPVAALTFSWAVTECGYLM